MPRIGITGHSALPPTTTALVTDALRAALAHQPADHLTGVTCLARGADQIFAKVVLDLGGTIEVILPAADYQDRKVKADNATTFQHLLDRATTVHTLPFPTSNRDAYLAASEHILATVEEMIAVWDGGPADGRGSTADVVLAAQQRHLPITVVWPTGAIRSQA